MLEDDVLHSSDDEQNTAGDETSTHEVHKMCDFNFEELCTSKVFDQPTSYKSMKAEDFNMRYYRNSGLNEVLIFDCAATDLGMKMVDDSFNVDDVLRLVGEKRKILCVNVNTQASEEMTLGRFIEHYKKKDKSVLYNVLSLEFSHSGLSDLVEAPSLIREIDWVSSWPDERKQRTIFFDKQGNFDQAFSYPRVENYCLISPNDSYTDFHIDGHGTSVWYHVKKGKKVFWIIEPTKKNLEMYETRDLSEFFGNVVEKCARVILLPGQTLIMPSGWIHSVFTPEDSLVFGGNFLHSRQINMQLSVLELENRTKINKRFMFPYSDETVLFYLSSLVNKFTGREYIRPVSRNQQNSFKEYVGELFTEKGMNKRIPNQKDYEDDGCAWEPQWDETNEYLKSVKLLEKWKGDAEEKKDVSEKDGRMKSNVNPKKELKWSDANTFFFVDHTFYRPLSINLDSGSETRMYPLPYSNNEPLPQINREILRTAIDAHAVPQLETLVMHFLEKNAMELPDGLSCPFYLLQCFLRLLRLRRAIAETVERIQLAPSILPDGKKIEEIHEEQKREEKKKLAERKRKMELKKKREVGDDDDEYRPEDENKPKSKKSKKSGQEGGKGNGYSAQGKFGQWRNYSM